MNPDPPSDQEAHLPATGGRHRTELVTLLFTDIVGSTALKQQLGDKVGATRIQQHHSLVREVRHAFADSQEIETAGDSFLLLFTRPSDAVRFALRLQARLRTPLTAGDSSPVNVAVQDRIGIHLGEIVIAEHQQGLKPRDLYGIQVDTCARVMSLASGGQILMTRSVFDNARQSLKGEEIVGVEALSWLNHGCYRLKGLDEPVEICEVRTGEAGPVTPPTSSEKAERVVVEGEPVLGWRPAVGQEVPNTRWVLEEKLGEGGFGEVWKARHEKLQEFRVFKFCFRADRVRSLKREVTLFRLLKERSGEHPNIVKLYDICFDEPPFYLEEEYVAGKDLKSWCEAQGGIEKVPLAVRLEIVAQAADGLQAAHDAGVIHRDVKPGNLLIAERGLGIADCREAPGSTDPGSGANPKLSVKLTDFGIGQVVSEEYLAGVTRAGFTQTMMSTSSSGTGTQLYMAPELLAGKPASTRSDIYSLGVVLFQLVVGDFKQPLTTDWAEWVPDPLMREDLRRCVTGKPEDRFAGAAQLAESLRALSQRRAALQSQQAALAVAERAAYRRGVVRMATVGAVVVAVVAGLAFVAMQQSRKATAGERLMRHRLYDAHMVLAGQALESGNLGGATELVRQHSDEPDLQGWEWRHLWKQCQSDELATLSHEPGGIYAVAFSPDGAWLAAAIQPDRLRLWDTRTWRLRSEARVPAAHWNAECEALAFSPDSRMLASITGYNRVKVWGVPDLAALPLLAEHPGEAELKNFVTTVAFLDGSTLATFSKLGELKLWDVAAAHEIATHKLPAGWAMAFSPDRKSLALEIAKDDSIVLWDIASGTVRGGLPAYTNKVWKLAFSPDGRRLASGDKRGTVKLWNLTNLQEEAAFSAGKGYVNSLRFSPDGQRLVIACDQRLHLWDVVHRRHLMSLQGHENAAWAVAFLPDGGRLISGSKDHTIRLWDVSRPPLRSRQIEWEPGAHPISLSPDGTAFARFSEQTGMVVHDLFGSGARLIPNPGEDMNPGCLALSPRGGTLAVASMKGGLFLFSTTGPRPEVRVLRPQGPGQGSNIGWAFFSADGRQLATHDLARELCVWDLTAVPPRRTLAVGTGNDFGSALRFSPDGNWIALGKEKGRVRVWSIPEQRQIADFPGHEGHVTSVAFLPDGRRLASAGADGWVRLWDVGSGRELAAFTGGRNLVGYYSVAVSPDGRRLAAMEGGEGRIDLWDVETSLPVLTMGRSQSPARTVSGYPAHGNYLAFTADGSALVAISKKMVEIWEAPAFPEINAAEKAKAGGGGVAEARRP